MIRDRYPDVWVFWIRAGSKLKFESSYCDIAQEIGLISAKDEDARGAVPSMVLKWLKNEYNGRWVMIVDGMDDPDVLSPGSTSSGESSLAGLLPRVDHGSVLITSRLRTAALNMIGSHEFDNIIDVDIMNDVEAEQLLKSRIPSHLYESNSAKALIKELENIPLAITQAAAAINYNLSESISDYLDRFLMGRIRIVSVPDPRRDFDSSAAVFVTWQLSFEQIKKTSQSASELLSYMSVLDNQSIPHYLLGKDVEVNPDSQEDDDPVNGKYTRNERKAKDTQTTSLGANMERSPELSQHFGPEADWWSFVDDGFESDIRLLSDFAMIVVERSGTAYSMHRLVQEAVSNWLREEDHGLLEKYRMKAVAEISMAFPVDGFEDVSVASDLYRHAEKVLKYPCVERITSLHRAELLYRLSNYMESTGSIALALKLSEDSLNIRKSLCYGYNICVARSCKQYAVILMEIGQYDSAEKVLKEALAGWSMSLGFARHLKDVLRYNLTINLLNQEKYQEAKEMFQTISDKTANEERRLEADLSRRLGQYEDAAKIYREVIESTVSSQHGDRNAIRTMVICQEGLARCLVLLQQPEAALKVMKEAISPAFTNLGPGEPAALRLLLLLGDFYKSHGSPAEAERTYKEALDISVSFYDGSHPMFFRSLWGFCEVLVEQSRWRDIVDVLEETNFKDRLPLNKESRDYWDICRYSAIVLFLLERIEEAKVLCDRFFPGFEETYGLRSPEYTSILLARVTCLLRINEIEAARSELQSLKWCLEVTDADFDLIKAQWRKLDLGVRKKQKAREAREEEPIEDSATHPSG